MTNNEKKSTIKNCRFKFKCHKTWQELEEKIEYAANKRYCNQCTQDVYLIKNDVELEFAVLNNYCVAIPGDIKIDEPRLHQSQWEEMPTTVGVLEPDIEKDFFPTAPPFYRILKIIFYFTSIGLLGYFLLR